MGTSYRERRRNIEKLYEYEKENNIPENERLTYNQNERYGIPGDMPDKKFNVDIRRIISLVKELT